MSNNSQGTYGGGTYGGGHYGGGDYGQAENLTVDLTPLDPDARPALNAAELALIKDGKPIAAMKAYHQRTGVSLVTAKLVIDSATR